MNHGKQLTDSPGNYTVQIFLKESPHVDSVTRFIKDGLLNGESIFVIARSALIEILKSKMDGFNFDRQPLQGIDQIRSFDA